MCSNQKCELDHDVVFSLRRMGISAATENQGFPIEGRRGSCMELSSGAAGLIVKY